MELESVTRKGGERGFGFLGPGVAFKGNQNDIARSTE